MSMFEASHFEVLKWFQLNYPDLVQSMRDSDHHFDGENLNPYHMENCVWSHTMLVFKNSQFFSKGNHYVKWSSLLHDIGKVGAREEVEDRKRVRFIGHSGLSAFMSIDILKHAGLSWDQIEMVFELIAHHGSLFDYMRDGVVNEEQIKKVFAGKADLLRHLVEQVRADSLGRFHSGDTDEYLDFVQNLPKNFESVLADLSEHAESDEDDLKLTVLVGPPCSGKSTMISSMMQEIEEQAIMDVAESFLKSETTTD